MGKIERKFPNPKDLAQLMRFKAPSLDLKKKRLDSALTIYDLRFLAVRRVALKMRTS